MLFFLISIILKSFFSLDLWLGVHLWKGIQAPNDAIYAFCFLFNYNSNLDNTKFFLSYQSKLTAQAGFLSPSFLFQ